MLPNDKASNPDQEDDFGRSVALSTDGRVLSVGASGESSSAKGVNGTQNNNDLKNSGAVYVFER